VLTVGAGPIAAFGSETAEQLYARQPYITGVLGEEPDVAREERR
jgi:hypothetical protein